METKRRVAVERRAGGAYDAKRVEEAIRHLRVAFRNNDLTIYVGAGASVASGVPAWNTLILTMYLNCLRLHGRGDPTQIWTIQAIGEHWFEQAGIPLDIAARQLRAAFDDAEEFRRWLSFGLYQWFEFDSHGYPTHQAQALIRQNATIKALVKLCRHSKPGTSGIRGIVTYNLDGLLEMALGSYPFQTIWKALPRKPGRLPIYHVHGYIPVRARQYRQAMGSSPDDIVLTEDQYNRETAVPYSWSNLVQLQAMAGSVGLAIGLSLSDPNLRRLLDVSSRLPSRRQLYAVLPRPEPTQLDESDFAEIAAREQKIIELRAYPYSGPVPKPKPAAREWRERVQNIWRQLYRLHFTRQVKTMRQLGVQPLWCGHSEIPGIIDRIIS